MVYVKTTWSTGDVITATLANHWETQYDEVSMTATYIIWTDGTTVYADTYDSDLTSYSGTDAATVIQNAIDALPASGGKIVLSDGNFTVSDIKIPSNITLMGSGDTTLIGTGTWIIDTKTPSTDTTNVRLAHLILDADSTTSGIRLTADAGKQFKYSLIEDITIKNMPTGAGTTGLYLVRAKNNSFQHIQISGSGYYGINVSTLSDYNDFNDIFISGMTYHGLYINDSSFNRFNSIYAENCYENVYIKTQSVTPENNQFINLVSLNSSGNGLLLRQTHRNKFENVYIEGAQNSGIYLFGATYNFFTNIEIYNCSQGGANTYSGIEMSNEGTAQEQKYNKFVNVLIRGNNYHEYNISCEDSTHSLDNIFLNIDSLNPVTDDFWSHLGLDNQIWRDTSPLTKNSGTATIAIGTSSITVAHGLVGLPITIVVTGQHEETRDLIVTTIGTTNFDIETGDGVNVTADRDVFWRAEY